MSSNTPKDPSKKRITKDQKIAQLKSDLKLSKEENYRLRKDLERSSGGSGGQQSNQTVNQEQQKKFREAMRAVKQVTLKQEMCIKTLRNKATQRRGELKERDELIKTLKLKVLSLENANKASQKSSGGDADLRSKVKELQLAYDEIVNRKDELEEILDEKESQLESLRKQRNSQLSPLHKKHNLDNPSDVESVGSNSIQSVSTAGDFDVARLKTELAKKSEKILTLQMDLETVKDELYEMKQAKGTDNDPFGADDPFAARTSDPFATGQDDWTDAEDTDNESEDFGDGFSFKETEKANVSFWD